jgi:hypothetical protein
LVAEATVVVLMDLIKVVMRVVLEEAAQQILLAPVAEAVDIQEYF